MKMVNKTLDLTQFNRRVGGQIRLMHIAEYANGFWKKGFKLSKIKLTAYDFAELKEDLFNSPHPGIIQPEGVSSFNLDLGHGNIKIVYE